MGLVNRFFSSLDLPRQWNRFVDEQEDSLFGSELNSLPNDPHELGNGDVTGNEKLAFVDQRYIRFGNTFDNDLNEDEHLECVFHFASFLTGILSGYFKRIFSASCRR